MSMSWSSSAPFLQKSAGEDRVNQPQLQLLAILMNMRQPAGTEHIGRVLSAQPEQGAQTIILHLLRAKGFLSA